MVKITFRICPEFLVLYASKYGNWMALFGCRELINKFVKDQQWIGPCVHQLSKNCSVNTLPAFVISSSNLIICFS